MGRLREWRDNNNRVHFQNAYLRTRGEWKKLRTVSKGRCSVMMLNLQILLNFGRKCCMVVVWLFILYCCIMLACSLFNFTVSAATNCSRGLFIMNMKSFRTARAPTLLLLSHALSNQLYFYMLPEK